MIASFAGSMIAGNPTVLRVAFKDILEQTRQTSVRLLDAFTALGLMNQGKINPLDMPPPPPHNPLGYFENLAAPIPVRARRRTPSL